MTTAPDNSLKSSSNNNPKIIIADDHPLFRAALCQALQSSSKPFSILECDTISSLEQTLTEHHDCDLILLDLHMPGADGFSGLILMRKEYPEIPVVVVSANEGARIVQRAIEYGACGFIPKSSNLPTISEAIETVLKGDIWLPEPNNEVKEHGQEEREFADRIKTLTPQQLKVFMMLTKGLLNKQIAAEIEISEATIRTHMTAIFRKLGVRNRTQAVLAARFLTIEENSIQD